MLKLRFELSLIYVVVVILFGILSNKYMIKAAVKLLLHVNYADLKLFSSIGFN